MDGQIFGPNVSLPCLPGLKSECENEILALVKEVEDEFQRKHYELLEEVLNLRTLCKAQRDEIDSLTGILSNDQNEDLAKKQKELSTEVEKLTTENERLKSENSELQQKAKISSNMEHQLESLKRSLSLQQAENKDLREKLKSVEQYQSLISTVTPLWHSDVRHSEKNQGDVHASSTKEETITLIAESYMPEKEELSVDFICEINQTIEKIDKKVRESIDADSKEK